MTKKDKNIKVVNKGAPPAFVFFLTFVGALVYFLDKADSLWEVILAFLQAAVWPALLVNKVFTLLQI